MKKNIAATSIAEALIILLVVSAWITGMYTIYSKSFQLSNHVKSKIQAIAIAREWIEAMSNIRDTNWILFPKNTNDCWRTLNYDSLCLSWWGNLISHNKHYKIYSNNDHRWILEEPTTAPSNYDITHSGYLNFYKIQLDDNWYYTQTWTTNNFKRNEIYTREIYTNIIWTGSLQVKSIVQWKDVARSTTHKVELENILTNWKRDLQ